ncbi:excitatory amino acid transporter-like isoform X2 [Zootermopsis nevadensis]|uniref:Amino acid transporter n=1 Tax=Zootermopsis nevadensis TaxID=136037 RepID=A0A067RN20_ZOONE|nr:excitatory amino acid transporter-like isoform X2 [Zootermopsis nevadensis]KDR21109.1 Excitatory amino acid transporter [Zootermopsis nevadensis]
MSDNTTNEANKHFRHYTFTKIESEGDASIKNCNETNVITSRRFQHFKRWLRDNLLLIATICGVIFSLFLGFILRPLKLSSDAVILISYPGELFTRLLKLFILPLIIASLIAGSAKLNVSLNGKIAFRTLIYFVLTSLTNAILGTILVLLIHPGNPHKKLDLGEESVNRHTHILDGLMDLGRNMFPDNLFQAAFQQAHTVYIPKNLVVDSVTGNNTSMPMDANVESIRMIQYRLTPVGIISVICGKILSVGDLGLVLQQVGWFIFTVALGVFLYQFVIMQLIYFIIVRRNPYKYYWGLIQATLTAFATASTAAALPVTFRCMDQKVGVDPRISRFILPIGCNINMDGTAMFVAISSFFIAQMNEMQLSTGEIITVCLVSTAASFSSASVPSAALALIFMVLSTIDAPTQEVSLLFAIDWFVDRIRTTNNMLGDCYAAAIVEHLSKEQLTAADAVIYQEVQMAASNRHNPEMQCNASSEPSETQDVVLEIETTVPTNGAVKNLQKKFMLNH